MRDRLYLVLIVTALVAASVPSAAQDQQASARWSELLAAFDAAGILRHADITYDAIEGVDPERLSLDVYTRHGLEQAPVVLFIHGGGWQRGDKRAVGQKPLRFVPEGCVVVASNYRFRPEVEVPEMARDVAAAVAWIKRHISDYGGDPSRVFLMGHSAGAHLVTLVGTSPAPLETVGLSRTDLSGVVVLDTGPYNVQRQLEETPPLGYGQLLRTVFGEDPAAWPAASPWHHVTSGGGIPPFLVFYHQGRGDAHRQSIPFVQRLQAAGVDAQVVEAAGKTHGSLNLDLGAEVDGPTEQVLEFLERHGSRQPVSAATARRTAG